MSLLSEFEENRTTPITEIVKLATAIIALLTAIVVLTTQFDKKPIISYSLIIIIIVLLLLVAFYLYKVLRGIRTKHIRGVILLINFHEVYKALKVQDEKDEIINYLKKKVDEIRIKNKFKKDNWSGFYGDIFFYIVDNTGKDVEKIVQELLCFSISLQLEKNYRDIGIFINPDFDNKKYFFYKRNIHIGECFERAFNLTHMPISKHILLSYNRHDIHKVQRIVDYVNTKLSLEISFERIPTTYFDIYKNSSDVFELYSKGDTIGSSEKPINIVNIEYRDMDKLIERLSEASDVIFVGISHDQTKNIIIKAIEKKKLKYGEEFWDKLSVIFPSVEYIKKVYDHRPDDKRVQMYNNAKRELSNYLISNFYDIRNKWEILEYEKNLPFTGTRLFSKNASENNKTKLRIAPILIGENFKNTHYIEICEGMNAFKEVESSFEIIRNNSSILTEWNFFLSKNNNKYFFEGLIQRNSLNELIQHYVPIVLIILYEKQLGKNKLVLQKRDKFNSRGEFNKYCNISGLLIDLDVFQSLRRTPSIEYKNSRTKINIQPNQPDLSRLFSNETNISVNDPFSDEYYWKNAAIRELEEELNLKVHINQLMTRGNGLFELRKSQYFCLFRIYSLQLGMNNVPSKSVIDINRPNSNLHYFNLGELNELHHNNELAPLLNTRYNDIFRPIFANELNID